MNDLDQASEEKKIKNAVIDLLHNNEDVSHEAISKLTGLSLSIINKHSDPIHSMLVKLKKVHTSPNIKC